MTPTIVATLLSMAESDSFDFKSGEYQFYGGTDDQKSELLRDIMALANAWKTGDAFIVIGISELNGRKDQVVGVTTHLKDADIQQFVNSKTNNKVDFLVYADKEEGKDIDVIHDVTGSVPGIDNSLIPAATVPCSRLRRIKNKKPSSSLPTVQNENSCFAIHRKFLL